MTFNNKTIIIISQLDWGNMFISKHHYALELSKLGNTVYYINGPASKEKLPRGKIVVEPSGYENLFVVKHSIFFPYFLAFKARIVFNWLIRIHIKRILKKIKPAEPSVIWSFDLSNTLPLKYFPSKSFKIFMPVDEPLVKRAIDAAESADVIFSVTQEIIDKYHAYPVPKLFINHGVGRDFINPSIDTTINKPVHAGLSGNFFRPDIDRETLLEIIRKNPAVIFDFWGSTSIKNKHAKGTLDSSLGGHNNNAATIQFIEALNAMPNVVMHGSLRPELLGKELRKVDLYLICYDIERDQSKGTNYHKVLEYLGAGKIMVSNNITTYNAYPGLLLMTENRANNNELLPLFEKAVNNLETYNSYENQQRRIGFAQDFLYEKQIKKIEHFITENIA